MAEAGAIAEHSASNQAAFQEVLAGSRVDSHAPAQEIDREQLAKVIIQLVNEDHRVGKAILDLVMTCPNVVVQY